MDARERRQAAGSASGWCERRAESRSDRASQVSVLEQLSQRAWGGRDPSVPRPPGSLWRDGPGPGSSSRPPSRAAGFVGVTRVRPGDAEGDDATPVPRQDAERPQLRGPGLHPKVNTLCATHKPTGTRYFEGCCQLFGTLSRKGAFSLINNSGVIYFTLEYFFFFGTLGIMVPISS